MNNISIIVATAENWAIGADNKLLWHISADLKRFKAITTSHAIVMGRKTYDSIGKPLPNRRNIVISRNENLVIDGVEIFNSIESAIEELKNETEVFVIGGANIYKQTLPFASKIYLTKVMKSYDGDAFFPEIDFSEWDKKFEDCNLNEDIPYCFVDYERK